MILVKLIISVKHYDYSTISFSFLYLDLIRKCFSEVYYHQLEEQKQAKVYEEFVREFEHDAPKVKTFVKGDVINSESSMTFTFIHYLN